MKTDLSPAKKVNSIAKEISAKLIAIRRDLHQYPELGFQEHRTCKTIADHLRKLGIQTRAPVARTGAIGLLKGKGPKIVALRADIDALPIEEANQVSYRSRNPGVMHACGHDGHAAMVLGAAMILKQLQAQLPGTVKFIFQPAEEGAGGADAMVKAGALRNPKPDAIFAIHLHINQEFGSTGITAGPIMAAADRFQVRIQGRGGHGARPELSVDPILAGHRIYQEFQSIGATRVKGDAARVITVCGFKGGGEAFNIIPDICELLGTVRTFDSQTQNAIMRRMREIIRGIEILHGVRCEFKYSKGYPTTVNDAALCEMARAAARELKIPVRDFEVTMGAEDFSYYQKIVPGAYLDLGIGKDPNQPGLHNNRFDFDDRVLTTGAALLANCALKFLNPEFAFEKQTD